MSVDFSFNIEEELKKLPGRPGVYIMHDENDAIIYVGKAISLKNRVRQYFQSSRNKGPKIEQMVTRIRRFEYIVTDSELEALVLECNLIKEHRPKYNTMLKDDKTYPFIKVTVGEDYPRVLFSRSMKKDKSKYYGPYTSAGAVKDTIDLIRKLYKLRSCNRSLPKEIGNGRPCLNYHIKQCNAPCQGYVSKEEYRRSVEEALDFLNGNYSPVLKMLEEKMQQWASAFQQAGDDVRSKQFSQLYRYVIDLLEQIHDLLGDEKISSQDYLELIEAGFAEIRLGTLPQQVDRVLVGDIERTRVSQCRVLFFTGVNDGNIPRGTSRGGLLSDLDREFLKSSGTELAPTPRQQMYLQRLYLYMGPSRRAVRFIPPT